MPSLSVSEWVRSTASARDEQFYSRDFEEGNAEREREREGEQRVVRIIEIRPSAYLWCVSRVSRSRVARVEIPMNG